MNTAQQNAVTTAQLTLSMSAETLTALAFVIDDAAHKGNTDRVKQAVNEIPDVVASMRHAAGLLISTGAVT